MGKWKFKTVWPINWAKQEMGFLYTLGIYHCNDYQRTLEMNWDKVLNAIETQTRMLFGRKLTLFQRSAYINACLLAKLWYIAHIYPLSKSYGCLIEKICFKYLWNGRYEPVKRATVYRKKKEGGLNLFNCTTKAFAILVNSFLKTYIGCKGVQCLLLFYTSSIMIDLIPREDDRGLASDQPAPFYSIILDGVNKCIDCPKFPVIPNKVLYHYLLCKGPISVEVKYPLFRWKIIW